MWEVDNNRVNKLIREANNVVCVEPDSPTEVSERRILSKLLSILHNPSRCLHLVLEWSVFRKYSFSHMHYRILQDIIPTSGHLYNFPYHKWTIFTCNILSILCIVSF